MTNQFKVVDFFRALDKHYHLSQRLRSIKIDASNANLSDSDLRELGEMNLTIQELNLSNCKEITDGGISEFLDGSIGVEYLNLSKCVNVTSSTLQKLSESCKTLKSLLLDGCAKIDDSGLIKLSEGKQFIINSETYKIILGCKELNLLSLGDSDAMEVTDVGITAVSQNCANLININFSQNKKITDEGKRDIFILLRTKYIY